MRATSRQSEGTRAEVLSHASGGDASLPRGALGGTAPTLPMAGSTATPVPIAGTGPRTLPTPAAAHGRRVRFAEGPAEVVVIGDGADDNSPLHGGPASRHRPTVGWLSWASASSAAVVSRDCHAAVSALADIVGEQRARQGRLRGTRFPVGASTAPPRGMDTLRALAWPTTSVPFPRVSTSSAISSSPTPSFKLR